MTGSVSEILLSLFLVLGGLGLFLYGIKMMSEGIKNIAGERMRAVLERTTSNRFMGIGLGFVVTNVTQSSTATTVMVVGFINAGMMSLFQSIGVIMGANIGTTVTGHIIAFKIDAFAPVVIFAGVILYLFFRKKRISNIGFGLLGFGILFFGISTMGAPLKEFSTEPGFQAMLTAFSNPLLALLAGFVFTAVIQSSTATIGIIIAMYLGGVEMDFYIAVFLVMGSNLGSCITMLVASVAASRESKRAALIHLMFNAFGCVFFSILIFVFPGFLDLLHGAWAEEARQVAMFHTIFNATTAAILVGFANHLARLTKIIIPDKKSEQGFDKRLVFIDPKLMQMPAVALAQIHRETCRMADIALDNLKLALDAFFTKDPKKTGQVFENEEIVDYLCHHIAAWLIKIRGLDFSDPEVERLGMMLRAISDIERIGDHAENIAEYAQQMERGDIAFSDTAMDELKEAGEVSAQAVTLAMEIFKTRDDTRIGEVDPLEQNVNLLTRTYVENHIKRLMNETCDPQSGVIFTNMLTDLERCGDHATNIAFSILGETVWDKEQRKLLRVADALD